MKKLFITLCLITFCGLSLFSFKPKTIEKQIKLIIKNNKAIGLAVVAVKGDSICYANNFAYSNLEKQTLLNKESLFRIASISKSFTATAIMQLIDSSKIDLEADVSKLMGFTVRNPNYPDTPITLRMLLSHSSSLNDSQGYFTINVINPDSTNTWSKAYNNYQPGTKYEYCNLAYNMLGTILERVSGERFDKYIVNHILKPIGVYGGYEVASLDSSKFVTLYEYNKEKDSFTASAQAYNPRREEIANYKFGYSTPIFSPTGGLKISAISLAKVMIMHMNYGLVKHTNYSTRIISEELSKIMQSKIIFPTDEGDAYGFAIRTSDQLLDGVTMIGHTGGAYGVYTSMFWDAEHKFGFIVMTNGCNDRRDHNFMSIHREVVKCLYDNVINTDQKIKKE